HRPYPGAISRTVCAGRNRCMRGYSRNHQSESVPPNPFDHSSPSVDHVQTSFHISKFAAIVGISYATEALTFALARRLLYLNRKIVNSCNTKEQLREVINTVSYEIKVCALSLMSRSGDARGNAQQPNHIRFRFAQPMFALLAGSIKVPLRTSDGNTRS